MKTLVPVHHAFKLMGLWLFLLGTNNAGAQCTANYTFSIDSLNPRMIHFTNLSSASNATYTWNYGDGSTSSTASPTYTYSSSDTFMVCLTVTSWNPSDSTVLCSDTICKPVFAGSKCGNADFTFSADSVNPKHIFFNSLNAYNHINYSWTLGDGNASSLNDPDHIYTAGGNYQVCLRITDATDSTCTKQVCKTLTIPGCPSFAAAFSYTTSATLNTLSVSNTSSNGGDSSALYYWEFGDGTHSSLKNPATHTYAAPGIYNVCLSVMSATDTTCAKQVCKKIAVRYCTPSIQTTFFGGGSFYFGNAQPAENLTYKWTYGDGGYSTGVNGGHYTYAGPGTYVVCLQAQTQDSSCTGTTCDTVLFAFPCNAGFNFYTDSGNNRTLHFTNTSTGQPPLSYHWNFGGAGYDTLVNPTFTFDSGGVQTICVTVTGTNCLDTFCRTINLDTLQPCRANFTYMIDSLNPKKVYFHSLSTGQAPLNYFWNFEGTGSSNIADPAYTFTTPGLKTVCLTSFGPNCVDTICKIIYIDTVTQMPCNADFSYVIDAATKQIRTTNLSTASDFLNYFWIFSKGDSDISAAIIKDPAFVFNTPGLYSICLIVSSTGGCKDTICKNIYVDSNTTELCNADFTYTIRREAGVFTINTFDQSSHSGSGPVNYKWTFSFSYDSTITGGTYITQNASHTFAIPGNKKVCLLISTPDCTDSICKWIYIDSTATGPCNADFTYLPAGNNTVTFKSTFDHNFFAWDFNGEGVNYSDLEPSFTFSSSGNKRVCLVLNNNCMDTVCKIIHIPSDTFPTCSVNFNYMIFPDTFGGTSRIVMFNSTTYGGGHYAYSWNFGDGSYSYMADPFHYYASNGQYHVCVVAIDTFTQCRDTLCRLVSIEPDTVLASISEIQDMAHIKLYPVPFSQHLSIDVTMRSKADVQIRVYDLLGISHYAYTHQLEGGSNQVDVDLSALKTGLYFVELRSENQTLNYRVLKN